MFFFGYILLNRVLRNKKQKKNERKKHPAYMIYYMWHFPFIISKRPTQKLKSCNTFIFSFKLIHFLTQVRCISLRTWLSVQEQCQQAECCAPGSGGQGAGRLSSPPCSARTSRTGLSGRRTSWSLSGSWTTFAQSLCWLLPACEHQTPF